MEKRNRVMIKCSPINANKRAMFGNKRKFIKRERVGCGESNVNIEVGIMQDINKESVKTTNE